MLGVVFEDLLLALDEQHEGLVDGAFRDQPVGVDLAGLAHATDTCDGLLFGRRLELRLHQDDDLGALEIDAHASGFDLQRQNPEAFLGGEPIQDELTFLRADGSMNLRATPDHGTDVIQHLAEEREYGDLPSVFLIPIEQLAQAIKLSRLLPTGANRRRQTFVHEIIRTHPVSLHIGRLQRNDLIGLGQVRQFRQDVGLDAAQIHRGELGTDLGRYRPHLLQERSHLRADLRLDSRHEELEFTQAVLQRGTRHEHDMLRLLA